MTYSRATELLVACGHNITSQPSPNTMSIGAAPPGGLCGDVFVGRAHDDEVADIWQRVDFTIADADPRSKWCDVARHPGGGGGGGSDGARSLSGLMNQNAQNALTAGCAHNNDEKKAIADSSFHEGKGDGYTWTQNDNIQTPVKYRRHQRCCALTRLHSLCRPSTRLPSAVILRGGSPFPF